MDSQGLGQRDGSTRRQGGGYSKQVPASLVAAEQDVIGRMLERRKRRALLERRQLADLRADHQ
jgi:hypothetical protein